MESINNGNLASGNHISPTRRPPLSNDITQFLVNTSSSSSSQKSPVNMNKSVASGSGTEKKNCNVKKVTISDDIEIVEEDSDAEEEEDVLSNVSTVVESPTKSVTSAAVSERANQEDIVDSTSAGRTPLSNDITQFLSPINVNKNFDGREKKNHKVKKVIIDDDIEMVEEDSEVEEESIDLPSESVNSIKGSEKENHGSGSSEKKDCKVKKTIISDDIEFVEEESEEEEEEVISTAEVSANSPNKPVTSSDAISRNSNQDHIISTNNVSISDVPFDMSRKIQMIKRTEIDEDICMIEAASDVEDFDISEPFNTTETSAILSNLNISRNDENGSMTDYETMNDFDDLEENEATKMNEEVKTDNHEVEQSDPTNSMEAQVGNMQSSFFGSLPSNLRKVIPEDYEYGLSQTSTKNGRLIVFEENDRSHVREYTRDKSNSWYCRLCLAISKSKKNLLCHMNDDNTFYALLNHVCQPITYEESKREQEKIKRKNVLFRSFGHDNPNRRSHVSTTISESAETRKVSAENYEFGFSITHRENGRLIVFEENDRTYVREYTNYNNNSWYCRFCVTISTSKKKLLSYLNDDNTFDALVNHICEPITYEESKRDQEKIKERFSNKEPLPGRKRARSVFNDTLDNANDTIAETTISNTTSSARSRRTRTLINPNYREDNNLNESRNTLKRKDESRLSESFDHLSNISFSTPSSTGYQEVPSSAWNYGYDSLGRFQKRIIVMDLNDKKYAHEYGIYKGCGTRCLGCYRVKNSYRNAKFDNQKKLFVPTNHLCTPKLYAEIKEEQKKFAEKNNRSENSGSSRSKRSRINTLLLKEDFGALLNDTRQSDADNDNPQGDAYDVDNWNDFLQAPSPPSTVNSVVSAALPIQTPSPPNSVRSNSPSNYSTSDIQFYHPSGKFLQICAEKLELNYSLAAYGFWARINIDIIKPTATPQSTFLVNNQKMSGFASLSLLFTGSEDSALEIKSNLNKYFLQNSLHIGDALGQNLSQAFNPKVVETISSDDLNEIHFVSFTRCLQCRCALFDNGRWKRYGKWYNYELETYVPIVLMEKKNGKYSPIFRI